MSNYTCHFCSPHSSLTWLLSLKSQSCICRGVLSRSVYFLCHMSLPHDSSKLSRETLKPLCGTTQQPRPHKAFCPLLLLSLLLNSQPSLKAELKSFLLQEAFLDPLPIRLNPPISYTPQALCTFIILALTYLSLSYIKVTLCICLSYDILSF